MHELRPVLGLHPQVSFSGPVDYAVTGQLAEEVLAVLREALTNVGKHAQATKVVITVTAGDELRVVVADDGVGVGPAADSARAPSASGTCASGRSASRAAWRSAPRGRAGRASPGTSPCPSSTSPWPPKWARAPTDLTRPAEGPEVQSARTEQTSANPSSMLAASLALSGTATVSTVSATQA